MENQTIEAAMSRALSTLRDVTQKLIQGVDKRQFEQEFRGKFVSPGVTVRQHVQELRISGSLEEDQTRMKLRQHPALSSV